MRRALFVTLKANPSQPVRDKLERRDLGLCSDSHSGRSVSGHGHPLLFRIWRGLGGRAIARVSDACGSGGAGCCPGLYNGCVHCGGTGLEEGSRPQCGRIGTFDHFGHPPGPDASEDRSRTCRQRHIGGCDYRLLRAVIAQRRTPRVEERQVCMAFWIQRGSARRSVRYEWSSPGDIRFAARMVSAAFSGDFAGIFSSGEPRGPLGLPACRTLDSRGESILPAVIAPGDTGNVFRPGNQPSPGRSPLCALRSRRPHSRWDRFVVTGRGAGWPFPFRSLDGRRRTTPRRRQGTPHCLR